MDLLWCAPVLWHLLLRVTRWPQARAAAELLAVVAELLVVVVAAVVVVVELLPARDPLARRRARSRW
jgi:hypothetical protein